MSSLCVCGAGNTKKVDWTEEPNRALLEDVVLWFADQPQVARHFIGENVTSLNATSYPGYKLVKMLTRFCVLQTKRRLAEVAKGDEEKVAPTSTSNANAADNVASVEADPFMLLLHAIQVDLIVQSKVFSLHRPRRKAAAADDEQSDLPQTSPTLARTLSVASDAGADNAVATISAAANKSTDKSASSSLPGHYLQKVELVKVFQTLLQSFTLDMFGAFQEVLDTVSQKCVTPPPDLKGKATAHTLDANSKLVDVLETSLFRLLPMLCCSLATPYMLHSMDFMYKMQPKVSDLIAVSGAKRATVVKGDVPHTKVLLTK